MNAQALALRLDLDLDATGICLACLSFVSIPLGAGDLRKARSEARRIGPDLWAEGLADPLRAALRRARDGGDAEAGTALAEVEALGARARVNVPVIQRLAAEQCARTRVALERGDSPWPSLGFQPWPPPELSDVYTTRGDV